MLKKKISPNSILPATEFSFNSISLEYLVAGIELTCWNKDEERNPTAIVRFFDAFGAALKAEKEDALLLKEISGKVVSSIARTAAGDPNEEVREAALSAFRSVLVKLPDQSASTFFIMRDLVAASADACKKALPVVDAVLENYSDKKVKQRKTNEILKIVRDIAKLTGDKDLCKASERTSTLENDFPELKEILGSISASRSQKGTEAYEGEKKTEESLKFSGEKACATFVSKLLGNIDLATRTLEKCAPTPG